jgi:hypothetical protein
MPGQGNYDTSAPSTGTAGGSLSLSSKAATGIAGFALVNGTPTILSWTVPNDGNLHRFAIFGSLSVTENETGGNIGYAYVLPDGTQTSFELVAGNVNFAPSGEQAPFTNLAIVAPGSLVTVSQSTALTAGAATLWAEIWGL